MSSRRRETAFSLGIIIAPMESRFTSRGVVKHMLLAIDVGNTQTVVGVYEGEELRHMWRVSTSDVKTADEMAVVLDGLFGLAKVNALDIDGAVLATVVPAQKALWKRVCQSAFDVEVLCVGAENASSVLDICAQGTGADRLANAVAAKELYGFPVVVVDLGTATDMEVVDAQGRFLGGVIAPGVETSMKSLVRGTALLPAVELADPGAAIGADTVKAIQIGVVSGEVDRIDGLVKRIWRQLGYESTVVATGGISSTIGPLCQTVTVINPELTLQGLRIIYSRQTH